MKCLIFRRTEHKNTSNEQIAVPFGHEIAIFWRNGHSSQLTVHNSQFTARSLHVTVHNSQFIGY